MLARFKKSLGESSNIISQSRISNSLHRELNMLEGFEKSPEAQREYIDKSSLSRTYRNSLDHNKLIKKIPELISENDQLKEKVKKMEEQLAVIMQAQKKRPSFSFRQEHFKQDEDTVLSSIQKPRASRLEDTSHIRMNRYSLDHLLTRPESRPINPQNHHSKFRKESITEIQHLKDRIHQLQSQMSKMVEQNRLLKRQNSKLIALKQESGKQIDKIVTKFQKTLKNKEQVIKVQVNLIEQKLAKLKTQKQLLIKEKDKAIQECQQMRKDIQMYKNQEKTLIQIKQTDCNDKQIRQRQAYQLNEAIEHLWSVKDAQFNNLITTLRFSKFDLI